MSRHRRGRFGSPGKRATLDSTAISEEVLYEALGLEHTYLDRGARRHRGPSEGARQASAESTAYEEPAESFPLTAGTSATMSTLQVRTTVAGIAKCQLQRWHAGTQTLLESDTWGKAILLRDYWPTLGITNPGQHFGKPQWWADVAWSAAFIMFCARRAASDLRLHGQILGKSPLASNGSHSAYTWQAYRDRQAKTRPRYWAYRPSEFPVEAGDIVVKSRGAAITQANAWARVTRTTYAAWKSHGDIVVGVAGQTATVVGGNVGNTVSQKTYTLDAHGHIDTTVTANDANRVFAVLRPEGKPFGGSLRGMVL